MGRAESDVAARGQSLPIDAKGLRYPARSGPKSRSNRRKRRVDELVWPDTVSPDSDRELRNPGADPHPARDPVGGEVSGFETHS